VLEQSLDFLVVIANIEAPDLARDDWLVSDQSRRFHPPEGLLAHEKGEFVCGKGSLGRLFPAAAIGLGGIFLAAGLLNPTTNCYNKNGVLQAPTQCASTNLLFAVLGAIMLMVGLVMALRGDETEGHQILRDNLQTG